MKLTELVLLETTEEDRAILSLSSSLRSVLSKYQPVDDDDEEIINVGPIGNLFSTPLTDLESIRIVLMPSEDMNDYDESSTEDMKTDDSHITFGIWDPTKNTIFLNLDTIARPSMGQYIAHELRHALDDLKSDKKANQSYGYTTPRSSIHQNPNNELFYLAEPREINARFVEVLNRVISVAPDIVSRYSNPFPFLWARFSEQMKDRRITELFPGGTKSRQYRRLLKRGADMINKEIGHLQTGDRE